MRGGRTRQHKTVVTKAGRSDISAASSCKRHQQKRVKLAKRCNWESFLATFRSQSERNRQRPPGYVRESLEKTDPAPRSAGIARHLSLCAFWHFQSTRKASRQGMTKKPHDPYNAARSRLGDPRANWIFSKGPIREFRSREVSVMSGDFVEVDWRSGLGAGSREVESETKKK